MIIAIAMICTGTALVILAIGSFIAHYSLNWTITGSTGAVLLVVGALILITELMEVWLSRGQTALVDGLQAG
jgi:hypothetical protein